MLCGCGLLVIAMAEVDTVDEAVGLANSTDYSLSASVWTKDVHLSVDVARRVRAGQSYSFFCAQWSHLNNCHRLGYVIVNGATIHAEREFGLGGLGLVFFCYHILEVLRLKLVLVEVQVDMGGSTSRTGLPSE